MRTGIRRIPNCFGDCTRRIIPHIKETSPTKKLNKAYFPKRGRSILQERQPVGLFLFHLFLGFIILRILSRCPFLDLQNRVNNTENQDSCTYIERPNDCIRHNALGSLILQSYPCEHVRKDKTYHIAGITKKTLDGIGSGFLFLIDHVAHQHLEGLHSHIDGRIKEHQCYQAENHRSTNGETERTRIGQQTHHGYGKSSTYKEIRNAAAETCPRFVAQRTHDGLNKKSHKRRKNPEVAQTMRVCSQCSKDS